MKLNGAFFAMIVLLGGQMMHANSPLASPKASRKGSPAAAAHATDAQQKASTAGQDGAGNGDPAGNEYNKCPMPVRVVCGVAATGCLTWAAYLQWCAINGGCE